MRDNHPILRAILEKGGGGGPGTGLTTTDWETMRMEWGTGTIESDAEIVEMNGGLV